MSRKHALMSIVNEQSISTKFVFEAPQFLAFYWNDSSNAEKIMKCSYFITTILQVRSAGWIK